MLKVIIAEKAIAGKSIASILAGRVVPQSSISGSPAFRFKLAGDEWVVFPLRGHITDVDFPKKYSRWLGTDVRKLVDAEIVYSGTEEEVIAGLKEAAKGAEEIIVATDADREGESIGVEALNFVKEVNPKIGIKRAYFSAISKKDLDDAFSKLADVDYNVANAADSRREIDLVWGAVLTRFLSLISGKLGNDYLSVGRVQSPTLWLVVQREKERLAFKSRKYWELNAVFEKERKKFAAEHKNGKFWEKSEAEKAILKKQDSGTVTGIKRARRVLKKPTPFNTTDFLRQATTIGFSAAQAMDIAERLYQQGYTSYPRTDNTVYPASLDLRATLFEVSKAPEFSKESQQLLAKNTLSPSKGPKETKDHPPIYPVMAAEKTKLSERDWKIYELIVRRFMATLADDAVTENLSVDIDLGGEPFVAHGQKILEAGWKSFYPYSELTEVILPELSEGEKVKLVSLDMAEKETQPPARYSQAALIKLMEDLNLGTKCLDPSTRVKVFNSPTQKIATIQSIFEQSHHTGLADELTEIRQNKKFECIGVSQMGKITKSMFALSSKRHIKYNEKMYSLSFFDGSSVKATEEHPFMCFENNIITFKPLSSIFPGQKCVALHNYSQKHVGEIGWHTFVSGCNKRTYLFAHNLASELKSKRLENGLSRKSFADYLGCSQSDCSYYESGAKPIPLWVTKKLGIVPKKISGLNEKMLFPNPFPIAMDSSLARILAALIGDGSLDREKVKKENCFDFRYTNTNPDLIERFVRDIKSVFKVSPSVHKRKDVEIFQVQVPVVAGRIISILFPDVLVKNPPRNLPKELYADFVGSFFDDEGHVTKNESKLFLSNTNHRTLWRLKQILASLGIRSTLDVKQHKLHVRNRDSLFNFLEKVPVFSCYKKQRLINILSSFYRYALPVPLFILERDILTQMSEPKTSKELQSLLGLSKTSINNRLKRLRSEGKIKKIVSGSNKDILRKISYVSSVDLPNTAYALLGETVISPELVTKTLKNVDTSPSPTHVYDITNSKEYPSFVLGNNLVVHNSTRHTIIQKLYARRYLTGTRAIEPNKIAFAVVDSLERHDVDAVKPDMTAALESEMDSIAAGRKSKKEVVEESRKYLQTVLGKLFANKDQIGAELRTAFREDSIIGKCDKCENGQLRMLMSKNRKRFLGCTNYPRCTNTYPLPQKGKIAATGESCPKCGTPKIKVFGNRYRFEMCVNPDCETKAEWKARAAAKQVAGGNGKGKNTVVVSPDPGQDKPGIQISRKENSIAEGKQMRKSIEKKKGKYTVVKP